MSATYVDRVKETSTTTGTGDITLAGAATGYQTFNSAFGTSVFFSYVIELDSGSEWEVGQGYLSSSTVLVRNRVTASSNGGSAVNFSAGTKNVFHDMNAATIIYELRGLQNALNAGFYLQ